MEKERRRRDSDRADRPVCSVYIYNLMEGLVWLCELAIQMTGKPWDRQTGQKKRKDREDFEEDLETML